MIDGWRELATSEALRYGLALAAAGLLPIKKEGSYRAVCVFLALLWASAAAELDMRSGASWWWSAVAAAEALLLLVLGLFPRRRLGLSDRQGPPLAFPTRNGAWAVAGTIAILYCLIAFPLLARFRWDPQVYHSALDFPFPLVLFTCGVLFFAVERTADLALELPLVSAFLGGPFFLAAGRAERLALAAALVAGVLFVLYHPDLRGGSERRAAPGDEYRLATRHRAGFTYVLWGLVLLTLFLFFFIGYDLAPAWGQILLHLALLAALGLALWLAFPAWHSPWFRYAAWHTARAAGRGWSCVRRGWKWVLLPLLVVLLVASQIKQEPGSAPDQPKGNDSANATAPAAGGAKAGGSGAAAPATGTPHGTDTKDSEPESWWGKLAAFFAEPFTDLREFLAGKPWFWIGLGLVLLWLLYQAYRGRKRLVIQEFANQTGVATHGELVKGLGNRLQTELGRISELYKIIDEAQPTPKGGGTIEVTAGVQDAGSILQEASDITVGSLKISGKFISGLVATLVRGPQLTGALHKVPGGFALTAQITGGARPASWLVELEPAPAAEPAPVPAAAPGAATESAIEPALKELVEQLAFRVAAELVDIGSPRWKAVRCFTDGLRYYRDTQRRIADREADLRKAERCLIRALSDDRRFTQCHHNLGVVYRELHELGSAQAAFRRALEEDPSRGETFYALAEAYVEDDKHLEAGWFCKAAIGIDPADARAWDLLAFARRRQAVDGKSKTSPLEPDDDMGADLLEMRRIAVALAWRSLCREALRGDSHLLEKLRYTSRLCTRNLAVLLARSTGAGPAEADRAKADRAESVRLLRQATLISPHDTDLRLHQGRALLWSGLPEDAAAALDGVFADGLDTVSRGLLWSSLTLTRARSGPAAARLVHRRFLDLASSAGPEDLQKLIDQSLETPPAERGT